MRLWTLHPKYLDPQGLVALWREALLARAVIRGRTIGYRRHPQLQRFLADAAPRSAINAYLAAVLAEAECRGYRFDRGKIGPIRAVVRIPATVGQLEYEWQHLLRKLWERHPVAFDRWRSLPRPEPHPVFSLVAGGIEAWERGDPLLKR
jgi:hypothetical protein